jgi:hypothetical protein
VLLVAGVADEEFDIAAGAVGQGLPRRDGQDLAVDDGREGGRRPVRGPSVAPIGLAVLAGYCGLLPLAVRAAAARPALAATAVVAGLAAACSRLTALDSPALEISVTASLDASYRALDAGTARAYRLLATCPGHEQNQPF